MNNINVMYKYNIPDGGNIILEGFFTNKIFKAGKQNEELVLWAENNLTKKNGNDYVLKEDVDKTKIEVMVLGTGWFYGKDWGWRYVDTVQMNDGLVWHVYVKEILV